MCPAERGLNIITRTGAYEICLNVMWNIQFHEVDFRSLDGPIRERNGEFAICAKSSFIIF